MSEAPQAGTVPIASEELQGSGLGKKVAVGAAWMVGLRTAFRFLGLISTLVLVRLLAPQDFGLAALASMAYAMLDLASDVSINLALVQMREPTRAHYDTAWTLVVLRGFVIAAIMIVTAPLMAEFLAEPRVENMIYVLSLAPILSGFENVGLIEYQRDLRFDRIFWYQLVNKIASFLIVIPAAIILRNYWALVIGAFAARVITIPLSYAIHPFRPRLSLGAFGDLFDFSKWLFVTNLLTMVDSYLMTLLLGRTAGASAVGTFQVANQIASLPASEVAAPVRRPFYAGYAKVKDDLGSLRAQILSGFGFLMLLVIPMSVGLAAACELVQQLGLGPKWEDAAPIVALCAMYALFDAIGQFTHNIYLVRGEQKRFVRIMAGNIVLRVALVIVAGVYGGVLWAVAALAATALLNAVMWFAKLLPLVGMRAAEPLSVVWRTFVAAGAMAFAVRVAIAAWPPETSVGPLLLQTLAICGGGAVVHVVVQSLLWFVCGRPRGPEQQLLDHLPAVRRKVARIFPRGMARA
ncbi:lipopolysaccharide biosynthesis protein [Roseiterribacter gracilis]|uniref:Lipopolysaccharide biosynthesis protein n=1 Tax=Roseiterribacter gracilis TaxID=2812848 RepID=A0A8S8X7A4_9PROT|nr:lipopolysaccharide biosynthesis protein [Rhodospirillales bacterium TMPK1]